MRMVCLYCYCDDQYTDHNGGIRLEFLPPYSPDLNPIEEAFSQIKSFIHRNCDIFLSSTSIMYDFLEAMTIVTADDARSYIAHSGY